MCCLEVVYLLTVLMGFSLLVLMGTSCVLVDILACAFERGLVESSAYFKIELICGTLTFKSLLVCV